jgi:MATE family multidrug resistance protein
VLAGVLIPFLHLFGQEPEVAAAADRYFLICAVSMIPAIGSMAVKNHADAMNHPWPAFWILLGGVLLNIFLNWVLIWGKFGAPTLGLEGAAIATLFARCAILAVMIWWSRGSRTIGEWVPRHWFKRPHGPSIRSLVKVGLPASLQLLAEVSAFVVATIIIGTISKEALASHQVAITCAATVFMVPLGISMALTVRVGEAWGAKTCFLRDMGSRKRAIRLRFLGGTWVTSGSEFPRAWNSGRRGDNVESCGFCRHAEGVASCRAAAAGY